MAITIRQFEMAVRATIENKLRRSLKVLGPTGIGKSEVIHQIAKSFGMDVVDIRLLVWSLTDLKGIPYPDDTFTYTRWLINDVLSSNQTALYTYKPEESADLVFATPRSWVAVSDLLNSGLDGDVLWVKIGANVGYVEAASFKKYLTNSELLPDIEALLNGAYLHGKDSLSYTAPLDAYWLLVQNLIHAINAEFRKNHGRWRLFTNNSIDFVCGISNFPLDLKKSYIDQLCEIDTKMRKYIFNDSRTHNLSKLLQELEYIKV